jgi:BASS family bile acid:Na+ symporter
MKGSMLTEVLLPVSLAIIMIGMGLSLKMDDFKLILKKPKSVLLGLFAQLVVLPLLALGILYVIVPNKPEYAVGLLLIAACPGGATSNLLSYLGKCDTALSIALTAFSSLITVFTIPFIVNFALNKYMSQDTMVTLPILKTIGQILLITVIPVAIGMFIHAKREDISAKLEKPVRIASTVFIIIVIIGVILKEKAIIGDAFKNIGLATLLLNVGSLVIGFLIGKISGLSNRMSSTISIEAGIQNGTLAIAIASSATLLNNSEMAIPGAVYSLIMFATGFVAVAIFSKMNSKEGTTNV